MTRRLTLLLALKGHKAVTNSIDKIKKSVFSLRTALTSLAVALGLNSFIQAAVKMDSLQRGLLAVSKNALEAKNQMVVLQEVARLPGLGFQEAIQGGIRLQAAGFSAKEASESLMAFGNAVATVGGGVPELDRIVLQLSQMSAAGKVIMQDLRPIIQTAPVVGKAMFQAFGTITPEDINALGISSKEFIKTLVEELNKLPRITSGPRNAIENMNDALFRMRAFVGARLLPAFEKGLSRIEELLNNNKGSIEVFANVLGNLFMHFVNISSAVTKWAIANKEILVTLGLVGAAIGLVMSPIVQVGAAIVLGIELWNKYGEQIKRVFTVAWNDYIKPFLNIFIARFAFLFRATVIIWDSIQDKVIGAFNKIVEFAKPVFDFLVRSWEAIRGLVSDVAEGIGNIWSSTMDKITESSKKAESENATIGQKLAKALTDSFQEDFVSDLLSDTPSLIVSGVDKLKERLGSLTKTPTGTTDPISDAIASINKLPAIVDRGGIADLPKMLEPVKGEFALIKDSIVDTLLELQKFGEALSVIGVQFDKFHGLGTAAFEGLKGAGSSYFNTVQAMSKAYYKGETDKLINFRELSSQVWRGVKAAVLQSIADQLKARANQWGAEALAALAAGNLFSAAKFGAAAALAGGSAAVLSGRADAIREGAADRLAIATGQPSPLTSEERAAGVRTSRSGGFSGRTTSFSQQPQNITIAPITNFNVNDNGLLVIGSSGIEEAAEHLSDAITRTVIEASKNGEI